MPLSNATHPECVLRVVCCAPQPPTTATHHNHSPQPPTTTTQPTPQKHKQNRTHTDTKHKQNRTHSPNPSTPVPPASDLSELYREGLRLSRDHRREDLLCLSRRLCSDPHCTKHTTTTTTATHHNHPITATQRHTNTNAPSVKGDTKTVSVSLRRAGCDLQTITLP